MPDVFLHALYQKYYAGRAKRERCIGCGHYSRPPKRGAYKDLCGRCRKMEFISKGYGASDE